MDLIPTPRTDEAAADLRHRRGNDLADYVRVSFARELERELTAEKADHADSKRQWNEALDVGLKVVKERDVAQAENAKLREALAEAVKTIEEAPWGGD